MQHARPQAFFLFLWHVQYPTVFDLSTAKESTVNTEELQRSGPRLYGNGLLARLHLSTLPAQPHTQESGIRHRWYGVRSSIPAETNTVLTAVQEDRGGC